MAHVQIIATMVYHLMENATVKELKKAGLGEHSADHGKVLFYTDAQGNPWTVTHIKGKEEDYFLYPLYFSLILNYHF